MYWRDWLLMEVMGGVTGDVELTDIDDEGKRSEGCR